MAAGAGGGPAAGGRRGRRQRSPRRRSLPARLLLWLLRFVVVLVLLVAAALLWLGTESGLTQALGWTQQLLARSGQALALERIEGNLWRGIRIGRFEWRGADTVVQGDDLSLRWSLRALLRGAVTVHELGAGRLVIQLPPPAPPRPREDVPMPGRFGLPVPVTLKRLALGHVEVLPAPDGQTRPEPLLVLKDVEARAAYSLGQYQIASLTLSSPWGRLKSATAQMDAAPPHRLKAELSADGTLQQWPYVLHLSAGGDLSHLPLKIDGQLAEGQAELDGVLRPLARVPFERLKLRIADANLARLAALGKLPETGLDIDLDLDPRPDVQDGWQGRLKLANRQAGTLADERLPLRSLQTGIRLVLPPASRRERAHVALDDLRIGLPVTTAGKDGVQTVAPRSEARISGRLESWPGREMTLPGLSLPLLKAELALSGLDLAPLASTLPPTALGGQIHVDGQKFLAELSQDAERMRTLLPADLQRLAAHARLRVSGTLDEHWLTLAEAQAALGDSTLSASGQVGVRRPHAVRFEGRARKLDLARWLPPSLPLDASWREGTLGADWTVDGELMAPGQKARLSLDLVDAGVAGQPLAASLRARAELDADWQPRSLTGVELKLAHGKTTRIEASGALGRPDDRLGFMLKAADLARLDRRLAGRVALEGHLAGAFDALRVQLDGKASGVDFRDQAAGGQPTRFRVADVTLGLQAPLALQKPDSLRQPLSLDVGIRQLVVDAQTIDRLKLDLQGSAGLHQLSLTGAQGKDRLHLQTEGRLALPREGFRYQADLETLDLSGRAAIRLQEPVQVRVDGKGLNTRNLQLGLFGGQLNLEHLLLDWSKGMQFDTRGRFDGLQPVQFRQLAGVGDAKDLALLQDLRAQGSWQLKGRGAEATHGEARMGLREQPPAGRRKRLGLRDDNGAVMRFDGQRLDGRLKLDLPSLSVLNLFLGPDLALDGSASVDGVIGGTLQGPRFDLAVRGNELLVLQRSAGFALRKGTLDARLDNDSLVLRQLDFKAGEGSLVIKGAARLVERAGVAGGVAASADEIEAAARRRQGRAAARQASVLPMDGNFDVVFDRFLVPVGPGQKVTLSGQTRLSSGQSGLYLDGKARVDEGLIEIQGSSAPTLPADVKVVGETAAQDVVPAEADEAALRIRSKLGISLGEKLRITGRGVEARLGGDLELTGYLPSEPQLTGLVRVLDGSYQAYGQDLKLTKGLVRFNGPIANPSLDVEARRPFLPVEVGLSITGMVSNPQIALVSKPAMNDTTKLSWLVLGVPPDEAAGAAQSLALQQAGSMLFGGNDGRPSPSIAERLGLDVFNYGYASDTDAQSGIQESLAPKGVLAQSGGDSTGSEAGVVSLGKRLNDRLFVSYEKGVRGVWNLLRIQYTLGKGYVARAQTGTENSIDLLRTRSFD